jgi:hypothetical protein
VKFGREPFRKCDAWDDLRAQAAGESKMRRINGISIALERGQIACSIRFLAKRWQWRPARVQRFLNFLVTEYMIAVEATTELTTITILNFDRVTECRERVTESAPDTHVSQSQPATSDCKNETKPPSKTGGESASDTPPDTNLERNPLLDSESKAGDGGNARAREPLISEQAIQLADDVMLILGIDTKFVPPGWCGAAMWLQAGLNSGWRPEIVRIAAAKIRARRNYQPPFSYRYLGPPITREHELMAEPGLPFSPMVVSKEPRHAKTPADPTANDWRASRDRWRAAAAKLNASVAQDREREDQAGEGIDGEVLQFAAAARRDRS